MLEKGKISSSQLALMMYPTVLATGFLTAPVISSQFAERDLWISPIWASLISILSVYVAVQLHKFYPEKTMIQYMESIAGTFIGKMLGFLFLLFMLHVTGGSVWEYAIFVREAFFPHTPDLVIIGSITLVCAFIVHAGVEAIGRMAQLIVPVVIVLMVMSFLVLLPEMDPKRILPIMENGILPSVKGASTIAGWFSMFIFISFLLPFVSDRENARKWGMISGAAVMVSFIIINLAVYFVFGPITPSLTYPFLSAIKYVSIADLFENLEAVVMAIWIANEVIKISVYYYILILGFGQWMNLSDYRPVILPFGLLIVVFAIWLANDFSALTLFGSRIPFYVLTFRSVLPLLLLLAAYMRKKFSNNEGR